MGRTAHPRLAKQILNIDPPLKLGLWRIGFMLCDRCTMNANCEQFNPNSTCTIKKTLSSN